MKIYICHDYNLKSFLDSKGFKHQASGTTPTTKEKYWVYYQTDAFEDFKNKYEQGGK